MQMRSFLLGLSFAAVFVLGCVTAPLIIPPATAGTSPQKWDYFCFDEWGGADDVTPKAKQAGREGWELVAASGPRNTWCFRRPL